MSETVHTERYNELYEVEAEAVPIPGALPAITDMRASTVNTYAAQQAARRSELITKVITPASGQHGIVPGGKKGH